MKRTVFLVSPQARQTAHRYVDEAPDDWVVTLAQRTRTSDQNAKFHALCGDFAKSNAEWMGKRRNAMEWKVLLVSGHAVATKEGAELVPGLEGEFVNLRESTALMSKSRGSSLIEYTIAAGSRMGVEFTGDSA